MGLRLVIVRHIGGSRFSRSINPKENRRLRALEGCQYASYHGMLWVYRVGGLWPSQRDLVLGSVRRNRCQQEANPSRVSSCGSRSCRPSKQVAQSATASVGQHWDWLDACHEALIRSGACWRGNIRCPLRLIAMTARTKYSSSNSTRGKGLQSPP
jgi:hypothetical protein